MEPFVISAAVWGLRGLWFAIRRWTQTPAKKLSRDTALKAEIDSRLPRFADDREDRGEAIVRDLRRRDHYPELDDRVVGRASPWFKVEIKGIYDRGLEVYTPTGGGRVVIEKGVARDAEAEDGEPVVFVGRIPFERIAEVDWVGDPEDPDKPHFYCWFDRRFGWRRRFGETVLYRKGYGGTLIRLTGVRYKPKRLSVREQRRINREYRRRQKDIEERLARRKED